MIIMQAYLLQYMDEEPYIVLPLQFNLMMKKQFGYLRRITNSILM